MIAFLDIETGGFNKEKHAICEIGMVIYGGNSIIFEKDWLIYPYWNKSYVSVQYDPKAMEIHGIEYSDLLELGESIVRVLDEIDELLNSYSVHTLAGHNINKFDLPWLKYIDSIYLNIDLDQYKTIDTLEISKQKLKGSHKLEDLCDRFGIQKGNHRALADAKASLELYKHLIKM